MNTTPVPSSIIPSSIEEELSTRTFENLVRELEEVAASMDRGDIGIEESANLYTRAAALHAAATQRLESVQQRLAALRGTE
jgi:exodeoxyribonuclease VII small subunit